MKQKIYFGKLSNLILINLYTTLQSNVFYNLISIYDMTNDIIALKGLLEQNFFNKRHSNLTQSSEMKYSEMAFNNASLQITIQQQEQIHFNITHQLHTLPMLNQQKIHICNKTMPCCIGWVASIHLAECLICPDFQGYFFNCQEHMYDLKSLPCYMQHIIGMYCQRGDIDGTCTCLCY